jgi:hypothetical protein
MAFFLPDLSAWQGASPNIEAIAAAPNMVGCILKATQGVSYSPDWFATNWRRARAAGGARYGRSWFRAVYHFGDTTPGAAQADYLLAAVARAGGFGDGDMAPAWDLEGSAWTSRQQIVDISSAFAERIRSRIGRSPILYTGSIWRQFGVKTRAGFSKLWTTHLNLMEPFGWPNSSIALWQFAGGGKLYNPATTMYGFPTSVPGLGVDVDMNVVMDGGVPATSIDRVRNVLLSDGRGGSSGLVIGLGAGLLAMGLLMAATGKGELR